MIEIWLQANISAAMFCSELERVVTEGVRVERVRHAVETHCIMVEWLRLDSGWEWFGRPELELYFTYVSFINIGQ